MASLAAGIREEFATKSAQLGVIWTELSEESRLVVRSAGYCCIFALNCAVFLCQAITTARDSTIKTLASVMASSSLTSTAVVESVHKQVISLCPELETSRLPLLIRWVCAFLVIQPVNCSFCRKFYMCSDDMLLKWIDVRLEVRLICANS
jgi:hypothetical protein